MFLDVGTSIIICHRRKMKNYSYRTDCLVYMSDEQILDSFLFRKETKKKTLAWGIQFISSLEHAASRQACSNNKRAIRFQPFRLALPLAWVG